MTKPPIMVHADSAAARLLNAGYWRAKITPTKITVMEDRRTVVAHVNVTQGLVADATISRLVNRKAKL